MKIKLIYNSEVKAWIDLDKIFRLLEKVKKNHEVEIIDTKKLSEQERSDLYMDAVLPSVHKKYKVRQIFGTKRYSGSTFGKQQPALLVYEEDRRYPTDTYPHDIEGRRISIEEFLEGLIRR